MFFSSVLVRYPSSSGLRTDTFASQRSEPSSMFTSETPICFSVVRRSWRNSRASAAERRSGSVTISTSGVPPRLKSTTDDPAPWMRPDSPWWISLAASSSRWARWMRTEGPDGTSRCPPEARGMSYWLIW